MMPDARDTAIEYARDNQNGALETLKEIIRIPSVSTYSNNAHEMRRAADWLASALRRLGATAEVYDTRGHPVIYGEIHAAQTGKPTVLVYGHYDVQPPDPLDLWQTAPYEPDLRGGNLYGRGASDMKGQVVACLKAVEAVLAQGPAPVNLKFLFEGEEEIGSPSLPDFMREHKAMLACDVALNPDGGMIAPDLPTIIYGLRGLAYFELRVTGPAHDLHSGMFGGVVHNPANALCELIAGMHDAQGRVTLPGFYDSVRHFSTAEHNEMARLPMGEDFYLRQTGVPALKGEEGFLPVERTGARPTLDVHGLLSGFVEEGRKTVIPSWAMAKISCRLVPHQQPEEIHQAFLRYLDANAPESIHWDLQYFGGGPAVMSAIDLPQVRAFARALETVWGVAPLYKREGGSIPVVADMQTILGAPSIITGFGLPDDNIHAPNEKLNVANWYRGIEALIHFIYNMAE
jgi:acetylornithine deacetylase/succinyl-diaminopimelate desuccinylase-like protein